MQRPATKPNSGRWPMPCAAVWMRPNTSMSSLDGVLLQIEPFPVGKQGEGKALTPAARQRGLDLFTQLFNERFAPSPRVPVERKIFINLNEAAEYSGMPKSWLLQKIKQDELAAFKFRGW